MPSGDPHADRTDTIPATQSGMGIISYLKYAAWRPESTDFCFATARGLGNYLIREANTPDAGRYPSFTRSTGKRDRFPLPPDCGSQGDRPFEIEPDKGGIAGYALSLLFDATGERTYLDQALQNARVLKEQSGRGQCRAFSVAISRRLSHRRGPRAGVRQYDLYPAPLRRDAREGPR
jgi:hypothetical protein